MEICNTGDCASFEVVLPYGSETREEWWKRLIEELKEKFNQINLVDVDIILNMFQLCQVKKYLAKNEVKSRHIGGGILVIMWTYENGHSDYWTSSKDYVRRKDRKCL